MDCQTWAEIAEVIRRIPERMCGDAQPRFLHDLASRLKGQGTVVEIGTCTGISTIALAFARKEAGHGPMYTIDVLEHPAFLKNITDAGVDKWVIPIIGRSSLVAKSWHEPIELLWIDGDHRYRAIACDITRWGKWVVCGGYIALHDYPGFHGLADTHAAAYHCLLRYPHMWRVAADRVAGSILVLQRIGAEHKPPTFRLLARNWLKNLEWYYEEACARLSEPKRRSIERSGKAGSERIRRSLVETGV